MATDKLTAAQALAVERRGGPILVSAAAGAGKTKVIVERLMRRILSREESCNVNDFLMITFTKKAAAELRARIAKELALRLAEDPENVHLQAQQSRIYLTQISTVHSFCADLLREFAYVLNLPGDFRILEEVEAKELREKIADDLLEERYETMLDDADFRDLVDNLGAGRDDRIVPQLLLSVYSTAQCRLYPERWLEACERSQELAEIHTAEDTVWGQCLIEQFQQMLDGLIEQFRKTVETVETTEELEKYAPLYRQNLDLLQNVHNLRTWDELYELSQNKLDFGRLPVIRDCAVPELQANVKAVRSDVIDRVRKWLPEFYGSSEDVISDLKQTSGTLRALLTLTSEFTARYSAEKRRLHGLDYGDLEHGAVSLLLEEDGVTPTPIARRVSERYKEIMVDEYQDTNQVQDSLFRAVSQEGKNRFMVGDVKQSIYRFRLADPTIFLRKYHTYPDAEKVGPDDRQRILLSQNFRSGATILEAVNAVFSNCMSEQVGGLAYGAEEMLLPGLEKTPLPQTQVELHCISAKSADPDSESPESRRVEAKFAADRIRKLLAEHTQIRDGEGTRDARPGDIVILLRSPKNVAGAYLDALRDCGIPAASDSGESILDTCEVETLINLLKVLDNVHRDVPLAGAMLSPIFGVTGSELALARADGRKKDLYETLSAANQIPSVAAAMEKIRKLRTLSKELPLHALIEEIRRQTDLEAVYGAMDHGAIRKDNLRLFSELAAEYAEGGKRSLHQFLAYVDTLKEQGGVSRQSLRTDAVTVMSIHKSKGLEFPIVLLCGLTKRFNTDDQKAIVQFHSELGIGCSVYDRPTHTRFPSIARAAISKKTQQENLSEELRVLYVAMTRAQDMLIMMCCSGSITSRLSGIASRLSPETGGLLAAQASCMGDWVLQTALLREEAGALHEVAGRPEGVSPSDTPWLITYRDLAAPETAKAEPTAEPDATESHLDPEMIQRGLSYVYPHRAAARIPAKLTATQMKGRNLDEEASEDCALEWHRRPSRIPNLIYEDRPLTSAERGIAMHQAMQYLSFDRISTVDEIREQLEQMVADAFLTKKQADAVAPEKLFAVFQGELGSAIKAADRVVREFKFSILLPASRLYPNVDDEKIILQGVTDCCLISGGELTVIDFKTDRVAPGTEREAGEKYRPQLSAYSLALSEIFQMPVRHRILYFFETDTAIELA